VGRDDHQLKPMTEPLHPVDVRLRREVDPIAPVRLTPVERELQRERREQARKRRRPAPEPPAPADGHVDLRA
jgi:hypothetical protein